MFSKIEAKVKKLFEKKYTIKIDPVPTGWKWRIVETGTNGHSPTKDAAIKTAENYVERQKKWDEHLRTEKMRYKV